MLEAEPPRPPGEPPEPLRPSEDPQERNIPRFNVWNRRHEGRFVGVMDLQPVHEMSQTRRINKSQAIIRGETQTEPVQVDAVTLRKVQAKLEANHAHHAHQRRVRLPAHRHHPLRALQPDHVGPEHPYRGKGADRPGYRRYVCTGYFAHGKATCNLNAKEEGPPVTAIILLPVSKVNKDFDLEGCRDP